MIIKFALIMVYLTALSYGLFFAERFGRATAHEKAYNLEPFHEITRYLTNVDTLGVGIVVLNVIGNIVVFFPFGFLIPSLWPENDKRHPIAIVLLTLLFSLTVEVLQYLTGVGSADVDDVMLNTLGGWIGYMLYALWRRACYGAMNREL